MINTSALAQKKLQACLQSVYALQQSDALNHLSNGVIYPLDKWVSSFDSLSAEYKKLVSSQDIRIRIAVVGSFSAGKSCFINSILGESVAPEDINPTTQGITRFVFGEAKTFYDGNEQISYDDYCRQIKQEGSKEFLVTYPCEFLHNKELIDTVGLFEPKKAQAHWEMSEKDKEFLRQADVLLYLIEGGNAVLKKEEEDFLCEILDTNLEKKPLLYIILNKMDKLSLTNRRRLQEYTEKFCDEHNLKLEKCMPYCSRLNKTRPELVEARTELHKTLDMIEDRLKFLHQHEITNKKAILDRQLKTICQRILNLLPSDFSLVQNIDEQLKVIRQKEIDDWRKVFNKIVNDIATECLESPELIEWENCGWFVHDIFDFCRIDSRRWVGTISLRVFDGWKYFFDAWSFHSKKAEESARNICAEVFDAEVLDEVGLRETLTEEFELWNLKCSSKRASIEEKIKKRALVYIQKWAKQPIQKAAEALAADTRRQEQIKLVKAQTLVETFRKSLKS